MKNSKLIHLLKTFTKEEFRSFGKFAGSPYFYKDKVIVKLYNSLKSFYPEFNSDKLTKESLFREMYPARIHNNSYMKYLMSEMFGMGKKFLAYNTIEKDLFETDLRVLKELTTRNLPKLFESHLRRLEIGLKNYTSRNEEYFHNMYKFKELVSDFYSYKDRLSVKREHNKIIENIINSFLLSLLDTYYTISNDIDFFGIKFELDLVTYIEDLIETNMAIISPVVLINYHFFMLSHTKKDDHYLKLLELKEKYVHILDDLGKHRIYETLGNYCIDNYQLRGIKYYREAFNLFNDEIRSGVRFNRKEFSEIFFTNKIEISSKLKEFKWAYDFIEKYKNRLSSYNRNDIVNFCYATIEFESENYLASLDHLAKIDLHHPITRFRIRNYTLLNYYELGYLEQAFSLLDTYRHMLVKEKKIEKSRKERYLAFLSMYQKLLEIKGGNKKIDRDFFKNEIGSKAVFMKEWLLEKVNQL